MRTLARRVASSHVPFQPLRLSHQQAVQRSQHFYQLMHTRRSIRMFSPDPVPIQVLHNAIRTAGTAPSGAHKQPWTFVVVQDPEKKRQLREACEREEKLNYGATEGMEGGRMSKQWLSDLKPLATNWEKKYLTEAPFVIVVFKQMYSLEGKDGDVVKKGNYYQSESVGIASGLLIAALHNAGLCTLTHTPHPLKFLGDLLDRPKTERAFLVMPVGYPAEDATVPELRRKSLDEIMVTF